MKHLNPWLAGALKQARRKYEDSDRKTFAARMFDDLVKRVHKLATNTAVRAPDPRIVREQLEDGSVVLTMEWFDRDACWHLYFSVWRKLGEKPHVMLDFASTGGYSAEDPTDLDVQKALHDYFEAWKTEKNA